MKNPQNLENVIKATKEILSELLVQDINNIKSDSKIVEDLNADSLDIVDLSFQLGRLFGCTLPKINVIDHATEIFGNSEKFVSGGRLTAEGKELMETSLSGYDSSQISVGMVPSDIFTKTTVKNWALQCYNIFNFLPEKCSDCGGYEATINVKNQTVCTSCSSKIIPLDGDSASKLIISELAKRYTETA